MSQWKFYPIWGLNVTEDQGLESPIFGDATITSRASSNTEAAHLLSGGGFRDFLRQKNVQLSRVRGEPRGDATRRVHCSSSQEGR